MRGSVNAMPEVNEVKIMKRRAGAAPGLEVRTPSLPHFTAFHLILTSFFIQWLLTGPTSTHNPTSFSHLHLKGAVVTFFFFFYLSTSKGSESYV